MRVAEVVRREEEARKVLAEQTKQLEEDRKRWLSDKRAREEEVRFQAHSHTKKQNSHLCYVHIHNTNTYIRHA